MKKIILISLFNLSISILFSQELSVRNSFWGYGFKNGNKNLSIDDTRTLLSENKMTESISKLNKAQGNQVMSNLFGFAGGFMVGWELGNLLSGEKINGAVMGGGGAGIIISYVFGAAAKKGFKNVASDFNNRNGTGMSFEPSSSGLGVVIKF